MNFAVYGDPTNTAAEELKRRGAPLVISYPSDGTWFTNHPFMKHYPNGCVQPGAVLLDRQGQVLWSHCVKPALANGGGALQRAQPDAAWQAVQAVLAGRKPPSADELGVTHAKPLEFLWSENYAQWRRMVVLMLAVAALIARKYFSRL